MVKMREIWDNDTGQSIRMAAVNAKEALRRDPERYSLTQRPRDRKPGDADDRATTDGPGTTTSMERDRAEATPPKARDAKQRELARESDERIESAHVAERKAKREIALELNRKSTADLEALDRGERFVSKPEPFTDRQARFVAPVAPAPPSPTPAPKEMPDFKPASTAEKAHAADARRLATEKAGKAEDRRHK